MAKLAYFIVYFIGFAGACAILQANLTYGSSVNLRRRQLGIPGSFTPEEHLKPVYKRIFNLLSKEKSHRKYQYTFSDVAKDSEIQMMLDSVNMTHLGGPMLGAISHESVKVWLRTRKPATVAVKVYNALDGFEKTFGPMQTSDKTNMVASIPVKGLKASTQYDYTIYIDGVEIDIPDETVITTAPRPGKYKNTMTRIAFGADSHVYGLNNQQQANRIRDRRPLGLILLGDIAAQDCGMLFGKHRAHYFRRDFFPAWKSLVASIPIYASWDDHDYINNDRAGCECNGYGRFNESQHQGLVEIWRENWNNPSYGFGGNSSGIFLRTRIGAADVIMTDNRWWRNWPKPMPGNGFLGLEQMAWLKEQLLDCKGPFIILSCGTAWNVLVDNGKDSWGVNDPDGREEIFKLIEENNIAGVLLISGDRHGARAFRIPRNNSFAFYEFNQGSMGGWTHGPLATMEKWSKQQLYGMKGEFAFGEFTFDTTLEDPEVTFRSIRPDGHEFYSITLTRSQLTPDNFKNTAIESPITAMPTQLPTSISAPTPSPEIAPDTGTVSPSTDSVLTPNKKVFVEAKLFPFPTTTTTTQSTLEREIGTLSIILNPKGDDDSSFQIIGQVKAKKLEKCMMENKCSIAIMEGFSCNNKFGINSPGRPYHPHQVRNPWGDVYFNPSDRVQINISGFKRPRTVAGRTIAVFDHGTLKQDRQLIACGKLSFEVDDKNIYGEVLNTRSYSNNSLYISTLTSNDDLTRVDGRIYFKLLPEELTLSWRVQSGILMNGITAPPMLFPSLSPTAQAPETYKGDYPPKGCRAMKKTNTCHNWRYCHWTAESASCNRNECCMALVPKDGCESLSKKSKCQQYKNCKFDKTDSVCKRLAEQQTGLARRLLLEDQRNKLGTLWIISGRCIDDMNVIGLNSVHSIEMLWPEDDENTVAGELKLQDSLQTELKNLSVAVSDSKGNITSCGPLISADDARGFIQVVSLPSQETNGQNKNAVRLYVSMNNLHPAARFLRILYNNSSAMMSPIVEFDIRDLADTWDYSVKNNINFEQLLQDDISISSIVGAYISVETIDGIVVSSGYMDSKTLETNLQADMTPVPSFISYPTISPTILPTNVDISLTPTAVPNAVAKPTISPSVDATSSPTETGTGAARSDNNAQVNTVACVVPIALVLLIMICMVAGCALIKRGKKNNAEDIVEIVHGTTKELDKSSPVELTENSLENIIKNDVDQKNKMNCTTIEPVAISPQNITADNVHKQENQPMKAIEFALQSSSSTREPSTNTSYNINEGANIELAEPVPEPSPTEEPKTELRQ